MNGKPKYHHGVHRIPYSTVPIGAPFIDAEFGGVFLKATERPQAICIESDSAYSIGGHAEFKHSDLVYLCTRTSEGWVELHPIRELTRDETSLLLFFETQMVDYGGLLQGCRMNAGDHATANQWSDEKFIQFGRIASGDIKPDPQPRNHWVILSPAAWGVIHHKRRERADRKMAALTVIRNGFDNQNSFEANYL